MTLRRVAVLVLTSACATTSSVNDELQRYAADIRSMNNAAVADHFADDGTVDDAEGHPVRGPAAIAKYLEGFAAFHVIEERLTPDHTDLTGDQAAQTGTYFQRVTLPSGQTVEVHGRFDAKWRRVDGRWKITRVTTTPDPA